MSDTENTRILPVQMTREECATKALQLATVCQDIASAERDAKDVAAEAKERIKALEKDRDGLAAVRREQTLKEEVDGIIARQRARLAEDQDAPGGQETSLTATVGEIAGEPEPCVNPNCRAPITNKAQARAGRCGACAEFFRVNGVERHAGPRVVDKSVP
jgi:hypothetical protein